LASAGPSIPGPLWQRGCRGGNLLPFRKERCWYEDGDAALKKETGRVKEVPGGKEALAELKAKGD
jgi:hypothetical protein